MAVRFLATLVLLAIPSAALAGDEFFVTATERQLDPELVRQLPAWSRQQGAAASPPRRVTGDRYTVGAEDTLWRVARITRPDAGVTMEQMMVALVAANPDAFVDGNAQALLRGARLTIPDRGTIVATDRDTAARHMAALSDGSLRSDELAAAAQSAAPAADPAPEPGLDPEPEPQPEPEPEQPAPAAAAAAPTPVPARDAARADDAPQPAAEAQFRTIPPRGADDDDAPAVAAAGRTDPARSGVAPRQPVGPEASSLTPVSRGGTGSDELPRGLLLVAAGTLLLMLLLVLFLRRRQRAEEEAAVAAASEDYAEVPPAPETPEPAPAGQALPDPAMPAAAVLPDQDLENLRLDDFDDPATLPVDDEPPQDLGGPEADAASTIEARLDLARTYVEMGEADLALPLLEEVAAQGDDAQRKEARRLTAELD